MKIVKVIHGYPMRYNAGSEVYSQTLCHGLANRDHTLHVFTREEDSFAPDYRLRIEEDSDDPRIRIYLVNNPRMKDRYRVEGIDQRFAEVLDLVKPDLVHVGHLNHLSTSLLREAAIRDIPIVFTLHDYWLMCPRGQFMQTFPEDPTNLWAACDGQANRKCAERCYSRYFSGGREEHDSDVAYWSDWVGRRMQHINEMVDLVDLFIAPAKYLRDRYHTDFGIPQSKLTYLDYGFDLRRMAGRNRVSGEPFTFGYIGTQIPAKGIHDLIKAFGRLNGTARLKIWGRPKGQDTEALKAMVAELPDLLRQQVEWLPEYRNAHLVPDVFNLCDAIVVPSVWVENSPLVIHEAQQARIPVITAGIGGMAEYVEHEVNGLLFEHRSFTSLSIQMQRFVDDPEMASGLGERGYLYSSTGDIPDIGTHVEAIEEIYLRVISRRDSTRIKPRAGPWRITFDTNPDTCNLQCVMCEDHSPYSQTQSKRKIDGRSRRIMPFDLMEKIVAEAVPNGLREIIPSTMGEPLLYAHFDGILHLCQRYGVKLNLTTNGTFPVLGARVWAEKIVPVTSDIKISWNGATRETQEKIMIGVKWERSLNDLKTFIAVRDAHALSGGNRCRVTLQLTFMEANAPELPNIVRLAIEQGVDRIKGHHLWAHFRQIEDQSMRRNEEAIHRWNQFVIEAQAAALERTLPNGNTLLLENIFVLDPDTTDDLAPSGPCPFLGQEAWVSALGRFNPCCAPDKQRRTLGEFGDLNTESILNIWNGDAYRQLITTYSNRKLCRSCNMRRHVGGPV
jgi:glycosyltransferase involved in cell wall biosynthesis/MoaA/NifB/PqqE/SkfB family radical SAM enzyme